VLNKPQMSSYNDLLVFLIILYQYLIQICFHFSQESFHPVEVTEGVWVVPEWITPPVRPS
jgi:hypothetical protein